MMVNVGGDVWVDPAHIVSVEFDNRFYANGSEHALVITLATGKVYRIVHDGNQFDIYKIRSEIFKAKGVA